MIKVYRHRRLDTFEVFYVGIGNKRRPFSSTYRNQHWKNIVNKTPYEVEILTECETWNEACELEELLIEEYGRKDLGTGCLVNMTDGGDGNRGSVKTEKEKNRLRNLRKGCKFTKQHIINMSKPVVQLDLDGNVINEFISASDVFRKLKINHVNEVCKGHRKTAGGFVWKFKKDIR